MFKVTIRGLEVTCESTEEIVALVLAASTPAKPTKLKTVGDLEDRMKKERKVKGTRAHTAAKKARAKKARENYKKKKAAQQRYLTKKAAEDAVVTTAETHHGSSEPTPGQTPPKEKRADTGADVISALRRSGLPLTIPEIRDDLQRSGWKYNGPDPKGTIRATLNRLVTKGEVAKGSSNGALTFRIARVEHADPLPHQQRESDV
jgi:hypothetical protein